MLLKLESTLNKKIIPFFSVLHKYTVTVLLPSLLLLLFLILITPVVTSKITWLVFIVFLSSQLLHIFFYFTTLYQYSKYTSAVKFFWIRVFTVFWSLEFYLFAVVIFLFFISPAELVIFWDQFQINLDRRKPQIDNTNVYIITTLLLILINGVGYNVTYSNKIKVYLFLFILVNCSVYILQKEFESYYYYMLVSYSLENVPVNRFKEDEVLELSNSILLKEKDADVLKKDNLHELIVVDMSAKRFAKDDIAHKKARYFILLVILSIKFWHLLIVILINLIYVFIFIRNKRSKKLGILGIWQQNLVILLLFWMTNYLIYYKVYYKWTVYKFYYTTRFFDFMPSWVLIFEELYVI